MNMSISADAIDFLTQYHSKIFESVDLDELRESQSRSASLIKIISEIYMIFFKEFMKYDCFTGETRKNPITYQDSKQRVEFRSF